MLKTTTKSIFRLGIRQKIVLVLMFVLLSALSISGWFALQEERQNTINEVNQRGTDISRFVAKSLVYSVVGYDYHTIDLLLKEVKLSEDVGYIRVENLNGKTMAEEGMLILNDPSKMVIFHQDLLLDGEKVGKLYLGFSTLKTMQRLETKKFTLITRELFIIILIAIGEIIALSFIIIKPVEIISKSLHDREEDENILGTIPISSNDEFGELAAQFNDLSYKLNAANHELKSRAAYADEQLIKTNKALREQSNELIRLNENFKKLSVTDPLTNLFNRRHFEEKLDYEIDITKRHGDTFSLLLFDIDHFKKINDSYGHSNGDSVIKMIAHVMTNRLRETDVLCRIGGEEFVAICKRANKEDAIALAEDIRHTIENTPIDVERNKLKVTISAGVVTVTEKNIALHADNIFKYADTALYYSKENGRNCVTHYSDIKIKMV
ncbi:MAG: GGDEF domain-containing protein [Gammaproteobacteria bacterium]|nr:GGDEF domain-containing protein [Gammaproteobacteria bacterium]